MERRGEKFGWVGGWMGSFIWVLIFATIWIIQGHLFNGLIASMLFVFAIVLIVKLSPWKNPEMKYWKLMIPIYAVFLISIIFVVYVFNGFDDLSKIQYGLWIFPCLTPIFILGNKKWN